MNKANLSKSQRHSILSMLDWLPDFGIPDHELIKWAKWKIEQDKLNMEIAISCRRAIEESDKKFNRIMVSVLAFLLILGAFCEYYG